MLNTNFSPWPSFEEADASAVSKTLLSGKVNYWTGEECREFEREFAEWSGAKYAIALANGTLALDSALKALEVGAGDEVVVTSRTFLASASSIVLAGATPVFADVSEESQNITSESIARVLSPRTKAIICVHLAGWPCDMDSIMELAKAHGIKVIEDCAQAHGAYYKGRAVGSIGDIGAWSFCQDKIMTTGGEGGMVTTNDKELWSRMWSYKDHGKSWDAVYERAHPPGFRWLHDSFGTNWRMMEIQAVIGRRQLRRMAEWTRLRTANALSLVDAFDKCPALRIPLPSPEIKHAWYKFYTFVRSEALAEGWGRDRIMAEINNLGVPCYSGSCSEVYLERAFDNTNWRPAHRLPIAKKLGETSLMFLVHPTLKQSEISRTCEVVRTVLEQASR